MTESEGLFLRKLPTVDFTQLCALPVGNLCATTNKIWFTVATCTFSLFIFR